MQVPKENRLVTGWQDVSLIKLLIMGAKHWRFYDDLKRSKDVALQSPKLL